MTFYCKLGWPSGACTSSLRGLKKGHSGTCYTISDDDRRRTGPGELTYDRVHNSIVTDFD